jgi:hypothetical protein
VPIVVVGVWMWGRPWIPAGDWAMIELAVADMGTAHTRLLGPYSRMGWSHPGPLLLGLLAVAYRLTAMAPWSLLVGAAAINLAAVGVSMLLAWRRGGVALVAFVGLGLSAVMASAPLVRLADPWNPWVTVLATALLVLASFAMWDGDRVAVPIVVVAGSLLAQSHAGFLLLVAAVVVTGVIGGVRRSVLEPRWLLWAGGVPALVLWAPVLIDQVVGRGNLVAIVTTGSDAPRVGLTQALEVVSRQLGWGGPWMGGVEPVVVETGGVGGRPLGALAVAVVVFVAAAMVARWQRCDGPLRLQVVVGIAAVAGAISVSVISGPPFDYLIAWWKPLAALWWVSAGWSVWQAVVTRVGVARADNSATTASRADTGVRLMHVVLVVVAAVVMVNATVTMVTSLPDGDVPHGEFAQVVTPAVGGVVAAIDRWQQQQSLDAHDVVVELYATGDDGGWVGDALAVALVGDGVNVVVPRTDVSVGKFGEGRTVAPDDLQWLIPQDAAVVGAQSAPGGQGGHVGLWVETPDDLTDGGQLPPGRDQSPAVPVPPTAELVFSGVVGDPSRPVKVYVAVPG